VKRKSEAEAANDLEAVDGESLSLLPRPAHVLYMGPPL